MSAQSPELQAKIALWRQKSIAGTITIEEMREAVLALREGRRSASEAAASSGRTPRAKAPAKSADDLLNELGGL